ncbi:MBL fold metallo-hydrolase [Actinomadura roseirufa]|uniref:MBL fold metallo-hydrolase n=1 Tax=Actinomadura roseirufa TaxID=2094049 RepID=UPI001041A700|nr:MBL fold metallo-hydrolase [Actinomadura roseirufa]
MSESDAASDLAGGAIAAASGPDVTSVPGEGVLPAASFGPAFALPDAAGPVLAAVAEVVGSRPVAGRLSGDLVREHTSFLLRAIARSPGLRARAAALVAAGDPPGPVRDLAALLLHPDAAVVRAAFACLTSAAHRVPSAGPEDGRPGERHAAPREGAAGRARAPGRDRALERAERANGELKKRLRTANGRLEYARQDAAKATRLLAGTRAALTELDERVAALTEQLAIAQRRFREPRPVASALLGILEQAPATGDDAASRDPRNAPRPRAEHNAHLLAASAAAGLEPAALLRILRAVVDPPAPRAAVTADLGLRVTPLGGGTEIGGSCLLVEAGGTRILVDAGLRPGADPAPPRDIDRALDGPLHGVVVTHAHNDHCGYVPALVARRPGLRVLGTAETVRIMPLMWADSARLAHRRAARAARWGGAAAPLTGPGEVERAARRCEDVPFGAPRRLGALTVELFPAGHILGAAGVVVRAGDHRVVVTGDISGFRQETVDGYALPDAAREPDLLVLETTCCGEDHDGRAARVGDLVRAVREVCEDGGRVLVPAFALGRAQEIALLMRAHLPDVPVLVDGMAVDLSQLFETVTESARRPLRILGGHVAAVRDRPAELDAFRTGVVITTSGMLSGGPAVQWAARVLPEPRSALFLSGYQAEETPGRALLDAAGTCTLPSGGGEVTVPVRARVAAMRLSAHADRRGLLDIADEVAARRTMLVHGVPGRQRTFRETLRLRNHPTVDTAPWPATSP